MMETRIQRFIFETPNGKALGRALKVDGDSLMLMCVVHLDEHAAVHDCEDVDLTALDLVDDAVGIAPHLTEAVGVLRHGRETGVRDPAPHFREVRKPQDGIVELPVPARGVVAREPVRDGAENCRALVFGVKRPCDRHLHAPWANISSSILSDSSKASVSVTNFPSANSRREISTLRVSSSRARMRSISSQVDSKSATLSITFVARPFCVTTTGRWVRAVRAQHSASVRRYSVKGTTSSSRRGRWIGFGRVRVGMSESPLETGESVQIPVPYVKRPHAVELIPPCRLSSGLRPVNAEHAETRGHGEGGGLVGREWKRGTSGLPLERRCFFGKDLCAVSVVPLGDRKQMKRCVCQLRNFSPCLRASARSVLTGRRPFEGRVKR